MTDPGSSPLTPVPAGVPLSGLHVVVVGGGMTGHRVAARLRAQDPDGDWTLTVIGEEPERPYDRVHLTNWFTSRDAEMLALDTSVWEDPRITLVTGDHVDALDRHARTVTTDAGEVHP